MPQRPDRRWELDAVRGLMLVLMTLTHLPTRLSDPLGQPFGFVSAAEGFVMLSGYMAGLVYGERARRQGDEVMQDALLSRTLKIYACQAALLIFAFSVVAGLGLVAGQPAVTNLLGFYFEQPVMAFFSSMLLLYAPPLLDILPLYIVFMLVSPLVLARGLHQGWRGMMGVSVLLWMAAQFNLGQAVHGLLGQWLQFPVRIEDTGAFDLLAWQFLWMLGLWLGASPRAKALPAQFPRWVVGSAAAVAVVGLVWRHAVGQTPFPGREALSFLFDKWHLGPLRMLNFFALLVLAWHFGPWMTRHLPRWPVMEQLGRASLPVFCAHLVMALMALALFGEPNAQRSWALDVSIIGVSFAVLYLVAQLNATMDRRTAAARELKAALRQSQPGAPQFPASTAHTQPH